MLLLSYAIHHNGQKKFATPHCATLCHPDPSPLWLPFSVHCGELSHLNHARITVLEVSSTYLRRFPKDLIAKPRIIRNLFVPLESRHSNLEIRLRLMQKFVSYGRLSGVVCFVAWLECATFASHYII